jgi:calcineurin-like phosphoesterase family protein
MASYFTSDYHFGHANVIKYDNRPFKNVGEMDEALIENHNSVISDEDDLYFLGDFSFSKTRTEEYLQRLNGNKFFIKGNHDGHNIIKLYKHYGTYLGELAEVDVGGQRIVLCHYAMRVWNKSHRGVWQLYGHSHHSLPDDPNSLSFDVGINGRGYDYTPLSFAQVGKIMAKKTYQSVDHHGN